MPLGSIYDILLAPRNTEKSTKQLSDYNQYTFLVSVNATKKSIREAIKKLFDIDIIDVNIINNIGKIKRYKGIKGVRNNIKKAIVSVKKGQEINFSKLEDK